MSQCFNARTVQLRKAPHNVNTAVAGPTHASRLRSTSTHVSNERSALHLLSSVDRSAVNWETRSLSTRIMRHQRLHPVFRHEARFRCERRCVRRKVVVIANQSAVGEINMAEVEIRQCRLGLCVVHQLDLGRCLWSGHRHRCMLIHVKEVRASWWVLRQQVGLRRCVVRVEGHWAEESRTLPSLMTKVTMPAS